MARPHCIAPRAPRSALAVNYLLDAGADPKIKNKPGSTPFHLAVQNTGRGGSGDPIAIAAQRQIIEIFLAHGVSVRLKDGKGKTVADCAKPGLVADLLAGKATRRAAVAKRSRK